MKARDKIILRVTICFLAIGILMSFKLWISDRIFPLIPVIEILNAPIIFGYLIIGGLFGVLIFSLVFPNSRLITGLFCLLILLAIQDQMRWQPWFYHYLLFLFPFCFKRKNVNIGYFQLILIGIYFWGGVNKFNSNFINQVFPDIVLQITKWNLTTLKEIGYIVPLTELFIAFGLVFKQTQRLAIYCGYITHIVILIYLSPFGSNSNSIIIPWNIAMISFLFLCFHRIKYESPIKKIWKRASQKIELIFIALFLVLPIFSFFGKWDYYLSFNLYSGKNEIFYIAVEEGEIKNLVPDLRETFVQIKGLEGGEIIDINKWSFNELNVPIPPEKRIFKRIANNFCDWGIPNEKIMFLEIEKSTQNGNIQSYSCEDLK